MPQLGGAVLTVEAANLGVEVDRVLLQFVEIAQILLALVEAFRTPARIGRDIRAIIIGEIGERIGLAIRHHADDIARIRRAEDRQYEIEEFRHAVMGERLAEIARLLFDAPARRDIEHAADADRAIECEALDRPAGALEFGLEHVVREDYRLVQIAEEVANRILAWVGNDVVIDLREGFDQPLVDEHVEGKDLAIHRLERIVVRLELSAGRRIARRSGASAHRQKRDESGQDFFYGICEVHGGGQVLSVYRGSRATFCGWISFTT
jgi:hypothetical protein